MIEIEAPDGSIVEFPEGTPDEVIENAMREAFSSAQPAARPAPRVTPQVAPQAAPDTPTEVAGVDVVGKKKVSKGAGRARAIGQGLLFNFGDELEAMFRSGSISGPEYKRIRDQIRKDYATYREENPGEAMAIELGSGVASMLVPGLGAARGVQLASKVPGLARAAGAFGRMGPLSRAVTIGGAAGAVTGVGATEGDKLEDAGELAKNVVGGGALGAGLGFGASAASGILANILKSSGQRGNEMVIDALRRGQISVDDLPKIAAQNKSINVETILADYSPELAGLGRRVIKQGGDDPARVALVEKYQDLIDEAPDRASKRLEDIASGGYVSTKTGVTQRLRDIGDQDYKAAYAVGDVNDPDIISMISDPVWLPIWKEAVSLANLDQQAAKSASIAARRSGNPVTLNPDDFKLKGPREAILGPDKPVKKTKSGKVVETAADKARKELEASVVFGPPDVRTLDYLKRGMDAYIEKRRNSTDGLSSDEARKLRSIRNDVLSVLDEAVPQYGVARSKYRGELEVRDALEIGRGRNVPDGKNAFDTLAPDEATELVSNMSDAEKIALRTGYANFLIDKPLNRQRLAKLTPLFDDPQQLDVFTAALEAEKRLNKRRSRALQGADAVIDPEPTFARSLPYFTNSPGGFLALGLYTLRKLTGQEGAMRRVAEVLRNGTPDEIKAVAEDLAKSETAFNATRTGREALAGAMGVMSGEAPSTGEEVQPTAPTKPLGEMSDEELEALTNESPFEGMSDEELEALVGDSGFTQQPPVTGGSGAQEIIGSLGEDEALALTVLGEASPNPAEQRAVAHTILNRQKSGNFGESLPEILRPDQFNAWEDAEGLVAKMNTPQFKKALEIVRMAKSGELPDNTGGATHFYAPKMQAEMSVRNPKKYRSAVPKWAEGKEGRQIGATKFFAGVS